jgi:hypothetical protein
MTRTEASNLRLVLDCLQGSDRGRLSNDVILNERQVSVFDLYVDELKHLSESSFDG